MQNHKKLAVWQKADALAFEIYKITEKFPKSEIFGITSQPRRAVLSVPVNIVEGYARKSRAELSRFIDIALGSLAEAEYLMEFSERIGYIASGELRHIYSLMTEVSKLVWKFKQSL